MAIHSQQSSLPPRPQGQRTPTSHESLAQSEILIGLPNSLPARLRRSLERSFAAEHTARDRESDRLDCANRLEASLDSCLKAGGGTAEGCSIVLGEGNPVIPLGRRRMPDSNARCEELVQAAPSASSAESSSVAPLSKASREVAWRWSEFAVPILMIHAMAFAAVLPALFSWSGLIVMLIGIFVFGQGINLGYHRLLAHRSLIVPKWLEYFYVTLALCCMEESPAKWVSTHRRHHAFSDEPDDPHSSGRGLFWSHMGWLLLKRRDVAGLGADPRWSADILNDRWYATLERHWWLPPSFFLAQIVLFGAAGLFVSLAMGESIAAAWIAAASMIVWGVFVRTVAVWHITWSVNSLTHAFGYRNYETDEKSRNNWLVAVFASGEGWHNNHHHDPASASNQHRWWELDPTYYHIRTLQALGLARKVISPRHQRKARASSQEASDANGKDRRA